WVSSGGGGAAPYAGPKSGCLCDLNASAAITIRTIIAPTPRCVRLPNIMLPPSALSSGCVWADYISFGTSRHWRRRVREGTFRAMKALSTVPTIGELRQTTDAWRKSGARIAMIPTMGALHRGHLALVNEAQRRAGKVVVSIFVNPAQFAPHEDFDRY